MEVEWKVGVHRRWFECFHAGHAKEQFEVTVAVPRKGADALTPRHTHGVGLIFLIYRILLNIKKPFVNSYEGLSLYRFINFV